MSVGDGYTDDSQLLSSPSTVGQPTRLQIRELSEIAARLAASLQRWGAFHVDATVDALARFLLRIAEADVAFARSVENDGTLTLLSIS